MFYNRNKIGLALLSCLSVQHIQMTLAFSVFPAQKNMCRYVPTVQDEDVDIELPDFDKLFQTIREVSPLASLAMDCETGGFEVADQKYPSSLKWKNVESKKGATVHRIEKVENYNGSKFPVVRFRSSLEGPCLGSKMVEYIMKLEERAQWDPQVDDLSEIYSAKDVKEVQSIMGDDYGKCAMFGVGYTKTKRYLVVDGRQQLTLCGLQEFPTGASIIWGVEMETRNDHMFPEGSRSTRAKTQLYTTTLVPTGDNTFDAEYCLQLDTGGNLPSFLTTPIMIDSVKTLFSQAKKDFEDEEGMKKWMEQNLKVDDKTEVADTEEELRNEKLGLLMTP